VILQLSGPCDLDIDLGAGSWSYSCASLIEYYLYTKFDKDRINFKTWLGPKFRGHVTKNEDEFQKSIINGEGDSL